MYAIVPASERRKNRGRTTVASDCSEVSASISGKHLMEVGFVGNVELVV